MNKSPPQFSLRALFTATTCALVALAIIAFDVRYVSGFDEFTFNAALLLSLALISICVAGGLGAICGRFVPWVVWTTFTLIVIFICGSLLFILSEAANSNW